METVQPIRDVKKLETMRKILAAKSKRDALLFTLGINSALRVSDLLKLTIRDVVDTKGKPLDYIELRENKTKKAKRFAITKKVRAAIIEYMNERSAAGLDVDEAAPLFRSKKGGAITRQHAWYVINETAQEVGITERIGSHSLRKTWGFHAYNRGADITLIQQALNHAAPSVTLRYIGITQQQIDDVTLALDL